MGKRKKLVNARKAEAVKATMRGPVSNSAPASIMQRHPAAFIYLDPDSAALIS